MSEQQNVPSFGHWINGEASAPNSGEYLDVFNPASGALLARTARGDAADVDRAVQSATRALSNPAWRNMTVMERSQLLYTLGNLALENLLELAVMETEASGGTISRTMGLDLPTVADTFFTLAEAVKTYPFVENLPPRPFPEQVHTQVWREPVGVCGIITAWNFPLILLGWKLAPALAAGNTVVIKASELTPASTYRLVEIFNTVLPPGVLNVVSGTGPEVGEAMVTHPHIDKISFTGSTAVGKHIQKQAADTLKRVTLELGGKGPGIVMPDANIDLTAHGALFGVMLNAGQACESGTRLIVHESVHDELVARMVELAERIVVGNPMEPSTGMGPMSSEAHFNKVMTYIESAREQGATIACGGKRHEVPGHEGGFYVEPTVVTGADNAMQHVCDEIFGPIVSVITYRDLEEAIALANDTVYGLSAGVWTEDVVTAQEVARELRAGSIWINDWHMMRTDAPFGGHKQSGYGREMSQHSLNSYTEMKTVSTAFERDPAKKAPYQLVHPAA